MSKKRKKNNFPKNFPPECLRYITLYLPFKNALDLLLICKFFNEVLSDGITWSLRTKKNSKFRKLCFMLEEQDTIPKANTLKKQTDYSINKFLKKSLFYTNIKDLLYITKDKGCYGFTLFVQFKRVNSIVIDNRPLIMLNNIQFGEPTGSPHFPQEFIGSNARLIMIDKPTKFEDARNIVYKSEIINKSINLAIFVENFINECSREDIGENRICNIIKGEFVNEGYRFILHCKKNYFFIFIYWGEKPKKTAYSIFPIFLQ